MRRRCRQTWQIDRLRASRHTWSSTEESSDKISTTSHRLGASRGVTFRSKQCTRWERCDCREERVGQRRTATRRRVSGHLPWFKKCSFHGLHWDRWNTPLHRGPNRQELVTGDTIWKGASSVLPMSLSPSPCRLLPLTPLTTTTTTTTIRKCRKGCWPSRATHGPLSQMVRMSRCDYRLLSFAIWTCLREF